jgi:hypothetical protein
VEVLLLISTPRKRRYGTDSGRGGVGVGVSGGAGGGQPPDGKPLVILRIRLPDRKLGTDIAAKSLRKAQTAISEAGADAIALVLRGCLVEGDVIAEAALSAQPKVKHGSDAANGN